MKAWARLAVASFLGAALSGCGSAESGGEGGSAVPAAPPVPAPTSRYHEWREIWSVDTTGGKLDKTQVGFLHRSFGDDDPAGRSFILDLKRVTRGYVLPDGKAFVIDQRPDEAPRTRELGNTGLENGAKKILDAPGEIQFQQLRAPGSAEGTSAAPPKKE